MTVAEPISESTRLADLRTRYLAAQLVGDRREALRLLTDEGLDRGVSVRDVQIEVIQAAQREIGRLWQENEISVAQEHMATAISSLALALLYDRAERAPSNGKKIVLACVDGELHDLPARLVADALDLAGFEVRYLGASVPLNHLAEFIEGERPDLVALSTTMAFNVATLRDAMREMRSRFPKLKVIVGGGACSWKQDLAASVGADASARDAGEAIAVAKRLLEVEA